MNRAGDSYVTARNLSLPRLYDEAPGARDRQRTSNEPCTISLKIEVMYLPPVFADTADTLSM